MAKRALLVGCNYPGTNAELRGCINDVSTIKSILEKHFQFSPNDITVMIDTDKTGVQPTGKNIKDKLNELVAASKAGDVLFFHFSGHGTQVPSGDGGEKDGKNEAICPTDTNVIADDDFRIILHPLDPGAKFTMIADCCHSGTLLDHPQAIIDGAKDANSASAPAPQLDVGAIAGLFGLKDLDMSQNKNRALPFNQLLEQLSGLLGNKVDPQNVHKAMSTLFGNSASARSLNYLSTAQALLKKVADSGVGGKNVQQAVGCLSSIMSCLGGAAAAGGAAGGAPAAGNPGEPKLDVQGGGGASGPAPKLHEDKGILITGCQSHETSADACPSGNAQQAYGALTNGINTVLTAHFTQNPGKPIAYRTLVTAVRECLSQGKFAQNPCLECSQKNADTNFILP